MQASTVYLGIYLFHLLSCAQAGITFLLCVCVYPAQYSCDPAEIKQLLVLGATAGES